MTGSVEQTPDDHPNPARPRRVVLIALLGMLWTITIFFAANLYPGTQGLLDSLGVRFVETRWMWPLALAFSITVIASPLGRRRWPREGRRVALVVVAVAVVYGLSLAIGALEALLLVGAAVIIALLAHWVLVLPRRLAPPLSPDAIEEFGQRDRIELHEARVRLQNDIRTTALQAIAGVAVLAGAILAFQQLTDERQQATASRELALEGQASERFTIAVGQLGSDLPEVQLGGVYGLGQIAQQAPSNRLAVTQVLVAYLHRRSPLPAQLDAPSPQENLRIRAPEIQAALTVLMSRPFDVSEPTLDLSGLDLRGAEFRGQSYSADLQLNVKPGNLIWADLRRTDLRGAKFETMYLYGADFSGADLRGADFELVSLGYNQGGEAQWRPLNLPDPNTPGNFTGARADGSTKWESDFDWRAAGIEMM